MSVKFTALVYVAVANCAAVLQFVANGKANLNQDPLK
jgi:hypothetical protein